MRRNP